MTSFNFEYYMMPHKMFQPKEFQIAGEALRKKFDVTNPDTLFPKIETESIPIDGLPLYIENCWTCIREQKELNLPGERQMVATYRCGEIRQEAINSVQGRLDELQEKSYEGIIDDYKAQCKDILKEAYLYYNESAKQYHQETYEEIKLELTTHIVELLYKSFVSQLKNLSLQGDQKFWKALKNAFSDDSVTDTFTETCTGLFDDTMDQFHYNATLLAMEDAQWQDTIKLHSKELGNSLIKIIEGERNKQKDKLFVFSFETIIGELEEEITQPIKDLEDNFWQIIIKKYIWIIRGEEEKVKVILNDGFKMQDEEYDTFLTKLEDKIYIQSKKLINKTVSDLNSHLNRKFNSFFKKDSKGKNRNWKNMSEEDIEKLHIEWVSQFNSCFELFKKYELPQYVSMATPTMGGSFCSQKDQLLSADDLTRIKDKFKEDCEHALEEAIRLHHNINNNGIPIYFWVLFFYFAYDDIFRWFASPMLFYPMWFFLAIAALMQSLGLLMPAIQAAKVTTRIAYSQLNNNRK